MVVRQELIAHVAGAGPVVTTSGLRAVFTVSAIRAAVAAGDLVRVGHGRYRLPEQVMTDDAELAARLGGVLGGVSAARSWGLATWAHPPGSP